MQNAIKYIINFFLNIKFKKDVLLITFIIHGRCHSSRHKVNHQLIFVSCHVSLIIKLFYTVLL